MVLGHVIPVKKCDVNYETGNSFLKYLDIILWLTVRGKILIITNLHQWIH